MSDHSPDAPPLSDYVPHPFSHTRNDSAPSRCIPPAQVETAVDQARALAFQLKAEEH